MREIPKSKKFKWKFSCLLVKKGAVVTVTLPKAAQKCRTGVNNSREICCGLFNLAK